MTNKPRIAVLISGNGSNLQAILDYAEANYEVALVLSNRPNAFGLERAKKAGVDSVVVDHQAYDSREAFDQEMVKQIDQYQVDLVVLAGFMRILTPVFTDHYRDRLLNIHPSLLPKYPGLNTHQRALDEGDNTHGLSIHFVTSELDGGPVFVQSEVDVTSDDTADSLQQKVHQKEHIAYPYAINLVTSKQVQPIANTANQLSYLGEKLIKPITI